MTGLQEFEAFKEEILAHADDDGPFIEYVIGIEEYVEVMRLKSLRISSAVTSGSPSERHFLFLKFAISGA